MVTLPMSFETPTVFDDMQHMVTASMYRQRITTSELTAIAWQSMQRTKRPPLYLYRALHPMSLRASSIFGMFSSWHSGRTIWHVAFSAWAPKEWELPVRHILQALLREDFSIGFTRARNDRHQDGSNLKWRLFGSSSYRFLPSITKYSFCKLRKY